MQRVEPDILIRAATYADAPTIARLPRWDAPLGMVRDQIVADAPAAQLVVAEIQGRIVGAAAFGRRPLDPPSPGLATDGWTILERVSVRGAAQRQGVGAALLAKVRVEAYRHTSRIVCWLATSRRGARRWLEANGFYHLGDDDHDRRAWYACWEQFTRRCGWGGLDS